VSNFEKVGKRVALLSFLAVLAIGAGLLYALWAGNREMATPVVSSGTVQVAEPIMPEPPLTGPIKASSNGAMQAQSRGWTNPTQPPDSRHWDQRLEDILLRGGEINDKADSIIQLIKDAPADAQGELAHHLVNMAQDDHYDGVAGLLTNATTQPEVATVLMNDLLNRRNTLKLPMLLAIARNNEHPLKDQAKDMLELFLQADYGTNWDDWSSAVDNWLQQNQ
jgi:hypothetical protein